MSNLLKFLPQEILSKEDKKFIYNILNPLLFEKVNDINLEKIKQFTIPEIIEKELKYNNKFVKEFRIPTNIDNSKLNVYFENENETIYLQRIKNADDIKKMDDLKHYLFFYFETIGYQFLKNILGIYYNIKEMFKENENLMKDNKAKYENEFNEYKKKIYKSSFEFYKDKFEYFDLLLEEFDIIFDILNKSSNLNPKNILDEISNEIGMLYKIRSIDNEIIFGKSKLFEYLNKNIKNKNVKKYIFNGSEIVQEIPISVNNVFELITYFAEELSNLKQKYDEYKELLLKYDGFAYSLKKSNMKYLLNDVIENNVLTLENNNLTYFLNTNDKKLEIYFYFDRNYRVEESTLSIQVNEEKIPKSIVSVEGQVSYGYETFHYIDMDYVYYKITINDYLVEDEYGNNLNSQIDDIRISFDIVGVNFDAFEKETTKAIIIQGVSFLDNFKIYKKNEKSELYEEFKIPFKLKIDVQENDSNYMRQYQINAINDSLDAIIQDSEEIVVSYYFFDEVYEPNFYFDIFKIKNGGIKISYQTILPYVLIDNVMEKNFELNYYEPVEIDGVIENKHKLVKTDFGVFKKNFDEINYMNILNPYSETNLEIISKIDYDDFIKRPHTNYSIIKDYYKKVPFARNLNFLNKIQYDAERDCMIFINRGIQSIIPLNEGIERNKNYEKISYDKFVKKILFDGEYICEDNFKFINEKIYLEIYGELKEIEAINTEEINLTLEERKIFFDIYLMEHCVILNGKKYKLKNLYLGDYEDATRADGNLLYLEKKYGFARYKTKQGEIYDININQTILVDETPYDGCFVYDEKGKAVVFRFGIEETFRIELEEVVGEKILNRYKGINSFSLFYSGNALPENTNKISSGRENIFNSMNIVDEIYKIGRNTDVFNKKDRHELLSEEFNVDLAKSIKMKMEEEPYIMFKNKTASYKGIESYLIKNLKLVSEDIKLAIVYLVQRNRFLSEWVRLSSILPNIEYAKEPLKNLVADLMETKVINSNIDDLITIFKYNNYEKFLTNTNDINGILLKYLSDYIEKEQLKDDFVYFLITDIWVAENLKAILNYVIKRSKEENRSDILKKISVMTFEKTKEREKLYYYFCEMKEQEKKETIFVYKPIKNYEDWQDIEENNKVKFYKPFQYDVIDISNFIKMPIDWDLPLKFIRPLNDDKVYVRRDYRPIDNSIITNSVVGTDDKYDEYSKENIKFEINVDYLYETLRILNDLSFEKEYDFYSVNLVIVKWIVERIITENVLKREIKTKEDLDQIIKNELLNADEPNNIIQYNRIKHNIYLRDLGSNINEIYDSIMEQKLVENNNILLREINPNVLKKLDKIKKPIEHYFDFLFKIERYDIIAKILALFTEDVLLTSMIDLSLSINLKYSKGNDVYSEYEKKIYSILDEFLPIHTVLDKMIFVLKIMETSSSEAMAKGADVETKEGYLIDILTNLKEKMNISAIDRSMSKIGVKAFFPSMRMSSRYPLLRGMDDIPYGYDSRTFIEPGMSKVSNDSLLGMDDDWYIKSTDDWVKHDYIQPPEFSEMNWSEVPDSDYEQILDTYLTEYLQIKENIFEKENKIESYFIDYIPTIDIQSDYMDPLDVDVVESYNIQIKSVFDIKRLDWKNIGHDEIPYGLYDEPEDLQALVDIRENLKQHILFDFYDKINISVLDRLWNEIKIVYDFNKVPGCDEFGIDESYHQIGGEEIDRNVAIGVNDKIYFDINFQRYEKMDISLSNEKIMLDLESDYKQKLKIQVSENLLKSEIKIITNKKPFLDENGINKIKGLDEFGIDEYFHDSMDVEQIGYIVDTDLKEKIEKVRIDFNFVRVLPYDPYNELISNKFYRINDRKSELYKSELKDRFVIDVNLLLKDKIRIQTLDSFNIDLIKLEYRNEIYDKLEKERGGEVFAGKITDGLLERHIRFDFRENIVLVDKFTEIEDKNVVDIFGAEPLKNIKKEIYKIDLKEQYSIGVKNANSIERIGVRDRDYLKSIVVTEDTFQEIKLYEQPINLKLNDELITYYKFRERNITTISDSIKMVLKQFDEEKANIRFIDKLLYGEHNSMKNDISFVQIQDKELYVREFKNQKDSLNAKIFGEYLEQNVYDNRTFDNRKKYQAHDYFGQMMYDDESLERSVDTSFKETFINHIGDYHKENSMIDIYDELKIEAKIYSKERVSINISESLKLYMEIKQQPRLNQYFDEFGHDVGSMMFDNIYDEFDITTQLKENIKTDIYQKIVDNGVLVNVNDNVKIQDSFYMKELLGIKINDDIKMINVGFKDILNVDIKGNYYQSKKIKEIMNLVLKEKLKTNIIFEKEKTNISFNEKLNVYENNDVIDQLRIIARDSIVKKYSLNDDTLQITFNERLKIMQLNSKIVEPENLSVNIGQENIIVDEFRVVKEYDKSQVNISDKVNVFTNIKVDDEISVSIREKLKYGKGRKLFDTLRVYAMNRILFEEQENYMPDVEIYMNDDYPLNVAIENYKDRMNIVVADRLKIGYKLIDNLNIIFNEKVNFGCKWIVEREGVDDFPMDMNKMEYYNDNIENSTNVEFSEILKIVDKNKIKDTIDINFNETLKINYNEQFTPKKWLDSLNVNSVDNVLYGIFEYNYIWNANEWDKYGYELPFEDYQGLIPHDSIPYGELGHQQQGEDMTIVSSNISDSFKFELKTDVIEKMQLQFREFLKYGIKTDETLKSVLKDKIKYGEKIYNINGLNVGIEDVIDIDTKLFLKESINLNVIDKMYPIIESLNVVDKLRINNLEKMKLDYSYNDGVDMEQKYSFGKILKRIDKFINKDTKEIIDEVFIYRFYDEMLVKINQQIFSSALFKFDESIPLITKSKTKIDLYSQKDDGITRTFTYIKDRTFTKVIMYFADLSNIAMSEKLKVYEN
jgi:hypothetical protein